MTFIPNAHLTEVLGYPLHVERPPLTVEGQTCTRCNGAGGWNNKTLNRGGDVISEEWVKCSVCSGTGSIPDD